MTRDEREKEKRPCGCEEETFFDYVEGLLPAGRCRSFEEHLQSCAACRTDVQAYRDLSRALDELALPEPPPGFDEAILAAVLEGMPGTAVVPSTRRPRSWFAAAFGAVARRPRLALGAAGALAVAVVAILSIETARAGGWQEVAGRAVLRLIQGGVALLLDGATQLLAAIKVSDLLLNVARAFEPLLRSASTAVNAYGAEFWLFTTLLSLLALLGAVRLATGSAVERGIGRVHLIL